MPTRRTRMKRKVQARLKAVAGGAGALVTFVVTALLLAPGTAVTVTAWAPGWLRPVLPFLFVIGTAWAVERTRNRDEAAT